MNTTAPHKNRTAVLLVQGSIAAGELLLWGTCFFLTFSPTVLFCMLLVDWLLFSPLKAGRALFFETLVADSEAATIPLLFRYYRHGYEKTIGWRAYLWGERLLWSTFGCAPTLFLFSYGKWRLTHALTRDEQFASQAVIVLSVLLTAGILLAVEIHLLRLSFVPYLLSYPNGLAGAITTSRRLSKGHLNALIQLHISYAAQLLACLLVLPWLGISVRFHIAKASALHRLLQGNPAKNSFHVLQHQKKCGRIGR